MKRIFLSILLLFSASSPVLANDPVPAQLAPLAHKSLLLDITITEINRLVAVGEYGHILTSYDAVNWEQATVPVQSTLTAVFFINAKKGWAVGHDSTILTTKNGGGSWQIQQFLPEQEKPLLDVVFIDEKHGITVGAYGQFYRTRDGGKTWQMEFHDEFLHPDDAQYLDELKADDEVAYLDERSTILPHFNRIIRDGRTLYLVGEVGLIAKSNDLGDTWERFEDIYQGSFYDLARTQLGNLIVVGLRGNVFRSLKNGTPWTHVDTETTALLNSIVLTNDGRVLVLGNNGALLKSGNDGQKFTQQNQTDGKALIAGVWFKNQLIAVSDVGIKTIVVK